MTNSGLLSAVVRNSSAHSLDHYLRNRSATAASQSRGGAGRCGEAGLRITIRQEGGLVVRGKRWLQQIKPTQHKSVPARHGYTAAPRCCHASSLSSDTPEPVLKFESSEEPYSEAAPWEAIAVGTDSPEGTWTAAKPLFAASTEDLNTPTLAALAKAGIQIVESLEEAGSEALKALQNSNLEASVSEEVKLINHTDGKTLLEGVAAEEMRLGVEYDSRLDALASISEEVFTETDQALSGSLSTAREIATCLIISEVAERLPGGDLEKSSLSKLSSLSLSNTEVLTNEITSIDALQSAVETAPARIVPPVKTIEKEVEQVRDPTVLQQMKLILGFAGPALVIWLSGPLMSLIDTAVIGQSSSLELAALGPGTVVCDHISNLFMFLSVATSNLIATAMAHRDVEEAGKHLSQLLFVASVSGVFMTVFTHFYAPAMIRSFAGSNLSVVPAANTYAAIRGLAWPAALVMSVAQSATLGLQDAWTPLYVLVTASLVNLFGDILLCPILGMGIAGAAWATMASQYVGCIMMLWSMKRANVIKIGMSVPSLHDLLRFLNLAAPIFFTMICKTAFYTILTKVATGLGTVSTGAHQVMIGLFAVCAVCGEPLSQTAQSYLPALKTGKNRNLKQARTLLKSLLIFGVLLGLVLGSLAATVPWFAPGIFTNDAAVIAEMRKITAPLHMSLLLTPIVLALEGTLMAGRDLTFLATSMLTSLAGCTVFVLAGQMLGMGLVSNWWTLVGFQMVRLIQAGLRLTSSKSILHDEEPAEVDSKKQPLLAT